MMKKIEYQAPEMEVLEIKYQGILCESPGIINDDTPPTQDPIQPGTPLD